MSLATRVAEGFARAAAETKALRASLAAVATSGSYVDLSNKPLWVGTQAEYNAIGTPDPTKVYVIKEG